MGGRIAPKVRQSALWYHRGAPGGAGAPWHRAPKTLTKRLQLAVEDGDKKRIAAEHAELQRWIDKAASKGAMHRNAAARKKAQAARLVSGA